jgi:nucleotide-binding universal stress UspA family protein
MSKKFLVGLDGSSLAEAALPYTEMFARTSHASVVLVRVVRIDELPAEPPEEPVPGHALPANPSGRGFSSDMAQGQRAQSEAQHYLHAIAEQMGKNGVVAEEVVAVGDPATVLVEQAQLRDAEMIFLSTHGRSGLGRWIYGSVADAVMRRANVPVLLVPPACRLNWPRDRTPRILVPLDGSLLASEALAPAQRLATTLGAELLLVQVVEPLAYAYVAYSDVAAYIVRDLEAEAMPARAYLADVAAGLRARGLVVHERVLHGPVAPTIAGIGQEDNADLIAIASHGSGGVTRLLLGSVATGVVQRASVPILVVRPEAVRTAPDDAGVTSASGV